MRHFARTFARDETGAVTVDWVILTASMVFMARKLVNKPPYRVMSLKPGSKKHV